MKRSLASVVDVVVVLTVIAALFSGPSQAAARAADTEVPAAARDPFGMGTLYPFTTEDASLSVLPEYFVAHGLDVADAISYGNSVQAQVSEPVLQRASGGDVRLTSVPLPVGIWGSGLDSGAGDAILDWAQNLPDLASAVYYTPTQRVVVGGVFTTVVFTETLDDPFKVSVLVNNLFTDTITIAYSPAESGTVATCAVGHHRFNLGVYRNGMAEPLYTFPDSKIIFVFDYSDSDIDGDENDMTLKYWIPSSGQWVAANEICTPHRNRLLQLGYNKLTINPCNFSYYPAAFAGFYGVPTSGVAPLTVAFTNTSIGDVNNFAWTFGDGGTSTTVNPTHTYTVPGVYTVTLTASNGATNSHTLTRTNYITVYTPANADFYAVPTVTARLSPVVFTNTSTGDWSTSLWSFGDGVTSTLTNPTHAYAAAGLYTVTLTVSGLGGSSTLTRPNYISVTAIPVVADFVGVPTSGVRPLTVVFSNLSTGDYSSALWNYGDGNSSVVISPTHQYTAAGVYTVSLTVSGLGGTDTMTRTSYITVTYQPVSAGFTGTPRSGIAPLGVTFVNTSTGDYDTSAWTFGDGGSSSDTNPVYTYTSAGVYTVSLTASGAGGSDTETKTSYITVYEAANADFYGFPTSGQRPLTVVFTNTSTGSFSSSLWRFGDGTTSTSANPSHQYSAAGVYTVSLTVSGLGGSSTLTRAGYITVSFIPVVADFVGAPRSGVRPLTVVFTNTSTGDFTNSSWSFGDGGTSTSVNTTHQYTAAGVYTVSLAVSGPGGSDALTRTSYITVTHIPVAADFSGTPTSGAAPLRVTFTNLSTGDFDTSAWTFGDGGSNSDTNPVYTYTAAGVYTVSLTASGPGGSDTETKTSYITVYSPATADFVGTPVSGTHPLTVSFTNLSTGSFSSSLWRFGDGATSTATNASHTYSTIGVYTVSLWVGGLGSTSMLTRTSYITVTAVPVSANFTGTPTSGPHPLTVAFTNGSTGDYSTSYWTFGDGGTSSSTNPSHPYTTVGVYTVTLTVSGVGGTDALTRTDYITVTAIPVAADFWGTPTRGLAPLQVTFANTSTGDFDTSAWTFGDGVSSSDTDPVYTYTTTGVYTVSLQVSGLGGTDTATKTSYITVDEVGGSTVVDPVTGGSAVFSYSVTGTVEILVSTGSVSEDVTLGFTPVSTTTTGPGVFMFGNVAFTLDAYVDGVYQEDFAFLKPVAITINYSDEDVAGISEETLRLFYWDEDTASWVDVINTCSPAGNYLRYPGYNQFTVSLCHLCEMGMFGWSSDNTLHLPSTWKDQ